MARSADGHARQYVLHPFLRHEACVFSLAETEPTVVEGEHGVAERGQGAGKVLGMEVLASSNPKHAMSTGVREASGGLRGKVPVRVDTMALAEERELLALPALS